MSCLSYQNQKALQLITGNSSIIQSLTTDACVRIASWVCVCACKLRLLKYAWDYFQIDACPCQQISGQNARSQWLQFSRSLFIFCIFNWKRTRIGTRHPVPLTAAAWDRNLNWKKWHSIGATLKPGLALPIPLHQPQNVSQPFLLWAISKQMSWYINVYVHKFLAIWTNWEQPVRRCCCLVWRFDLTCQSFSHLSICHLVAIVSTPSAISVEPPSPPSVWLRHVWDSHCLRFWHLSHIANSLSGRAECQKSRRIK